MRGREKSGWNCHQYHANSEFYADYGRYKVEITVPKRFVVGATGPRDRSPRERRRHDDLRPRAGRRARLRLDRRPALSRVPRALLRRRRRYAGRVRGDREAPRPQPRGGEAPGRRDPPPPAAGSRAADRAPLRVGEARPQVVRPLVRPLSLSDADPGRPAAGSGWRLRRRVSDAVLLRHQLLLQLLAGERHPRGGDRHRARVRPSVLVRPRRQQRVRGGLARRGLHHLLDRQGDGAGLRPRRLVRRLSRPRARRRRGRPRTEQPRAPLRPDRHPRLEVLAQPVRLQRLCPPGADAGDPRGDARRPRRWRG